MTSTKSTILVCPLAVVTLAIYAWQFWSKR